MTQTETMRLLLEMFILQGYPEERAEAMLRAVARAIDTFEAFDASETATRPPWD
jgi:hypothetical protein